MNPMFAYSLFTLAGLVVCMLVLARQMSDLTTWIDTTEPPDRGPCFTRRMLKMTATMMCAQALIAGFLAVRGEWGLAITVLGGAVITSSPAVTAHLTTRLDRISS